MLDQILEKMVKKYRDVYGDDIEDIRLYGSYARGDESEFSDIDLVALVYGERTDLQDKLHAVWDFAGEISLEYDKIISPTVIPCEEFEKWKNVLPYYSSIEKEGISIG